MKNDDPKIAKPARRSHFERRLDALQVTVVGAGRAGSFACLALAMGGIRQLRVYDDDRLDPDRNLGVQFYRARDVWRREVKVRALARVLCEICPAATIEGIPARFPDAVARPAGPVVVLGVDTMESRICAAEALARDRSWRLLVDLRLGGSVLRCYSVRGRDELTAYRSTLYRDDETWGAACADSPDPHVALAASAYATAAVMAYVRGVPFPPSSVLDVAAGDALVVRPPGATSVTPRPLL